MFILCRSLKNLYVYIYTHIHTYIHTYIHTHTYIYMYILRTRICIQKARGSVLSFTGPRRKMQGQPRRPALCVCVCLYVFVYVLEVLRSFCFVGTLELFLKMDKMEVASEITTQGHLEAFRT